MRRPTLALLALASLASAQSLPKHARERHEYDLLDVDWSVRLDPEKAAFTGTVVNSVRATRDAPLLVFDCAKLAVLRVLLDGKPVVPTVQGEIVAVPTTAKKDATLKVTIEYAGTPEAGMYFVPATRAYPATTPVVYTQGEAEDTRYWLPTYDAPDDKATSRGTVTVPAGWSVLSNGRLLGSEGGVYRWAMEKPHSTYLISFVAGPYTEIPDGTDPVPVSIWTPAGLEAWGRNAFAGTDGIVRLYAKLTGIPYPWPKYAQSAVPDFMFGGMENVSATTQSLGALFPDAVKATRSGTGLAAHELAHQWFGDLVTTPRWGEAWINEGWATFMPHFVTRERDGEEAYALERYDTLESAKEAMNADPSRSMVWNDWTEPMDAFDGYAYPGGAARLFALMHGVGEDRFWKATQAYLAEYGGKNVDTAALFASFGRSLGADLSAFERDWFRTPGPPPRIEVRRVGANVVLTQTQPHSFTLFLDVWALGKGDVWTKRRVPLRGARTVVAGLPAGPVLVDAEAYFPLDAEYGNLPKADRLRLWNAAPNAAARMRLVGPLVAVMTPSEIDALVKATEPRLRARLVRYVASPDLLVETTRDPNAPLALAALSRLGEIPRTDAGVARLREVWEDGAANPDLRLAALSSAYSLTKDPALVDAASMAFRWDEGYRTWALARRAEIDPDAAREVALVALKDGAKEPMRLAAIRILGRVKDKPGERRAYDALAALMTERSNSPLRAAIGALAEYGDPAAIPLLEARKDHSLFMVRQEIAQALAKLKAR